MYLSMEVSCVLVAALSCVLLALFKRSLGRYLYLTTKISGPSLWDLITIHAKELLGDDMVNYVWKLCASYGHKPWGMWTPRGYVVVVSDCETMGKVFKSKYVDNKPDMFYKPMSEYLGKGLLTLNGPDYKRHRKIAGPTFRKSAVESHLHRINNEALKFVEKLREIADGEDIDIRQFIYDAIGAMSVTVFSSGKIDSQRYLPMFHIIETGEMEVQLRSINPFYYWFIHKFKKSTKENEAKINAGLVEARKIFFEEKVRAENEMNGVVDIDKKPVGALELLMQEYFKHGKDDSLLEEGLAETKTVLVAGYDTTTFTMIVTFLLLALHPDVQQRAFEEVDSILSQTSHHLEPEDLYQMEYLEMVIKESMRLFPPAPIIARKVDEEMDLDTVVLPKGSTVLINIMALHRDPQVFKDPLKFDPDRFSSESSKGRSGFAFIPFSSGTRYCPGQQQAFMMLKSTLGHVLRNFKILPGEKLKSIDDIKPAMYFTFHLSETSLRLVRRTEASH